MIYSIVLIVVGYLLVLLKYYRGYTLLRRKKQANQLKNPQLPKTSFTIIVPYRNEEKHLPALLKSIAKLRYPRSLFEVIMVNDESEDNSQSVVENHPLENIQNIQNKRSTASPKKDAITTAIHLAKNDFIITTDADCIVPKKWLQMFDICIQNEQPKLICGPVLYTSEKSFLHDYQLLDGVSLQGITLGSFGLQKPLLCNGANLAYPKSAFLEVNGFEGNAHLASGDDIFMLEKIGALYPKKLHYLFSTNAIVYTQPQKDWTQVTNQRVRWASKTSSAKNKTSSWIGLLVFLTNLTAIVLPLLTIVLPSLLFATLLFWSLKICADSIFIRQTNQFFAANISGLRMVQSGLVYPFVTCFVVAKSFTGNYHWKGRRHKK